MSPLLYLSLFLLALFILYSRSLYSFFLHRRRLIHHLANIPGPLAIPILGTTWQFKWNMAELTAQMKDWGHFYASQGHSLVKFWLSFRPIVLCIRPEAAKVILESNDIITKGPEYDILLPWLGTGLLISTGDKWRQRRKMLTPSFHFSVLNDFLTVHDRQSQILVDQLEPFAETGEEFDVFPFIKRCALDIICETAMGSTISAQTCHSHPYVLAVQRMNELAFMNQRMPWMWIKAVWYGSGVGFEYDRQLKTVTDFTREVIAEKMTSPIVEEGGKKAFLDLLLELKKEGQMSYEDIREEVDTFMFEGHDTTSASMGWTLWCLAHHKECQKRVCEEMDEIFGDSDRDCTSEDLKNMKYLDRCIKESLRLRPSVPNFTRYAEKDVEIDGVLVPKGCTILVAPMMIHCNSTVYHDPLLFDPDRFLEKNLLDRPAYSYIPFSAGPRNCIGQKFAIMEEKTVLSWFFRRYTISSDVPYESNLSMPEIILRPSLGFPVKIQRR